MSKYLSIEIWANDVIFYEKNASKLEKRAEKESNEMARMHAKRAREIAEMRWKEFWGGDSNYIRQSKKIVSTTQNSLKEILKMVEARNNASFSASFEEIITSIT